jgi:hypothetical protein
MTVSAEDIVTEIVLDRILSEANGRRDDQPEESAPTADLGVLFTRRETKGGRSDLASQIADATSSAAVAEMVIGGVNITRESIQASQYEHDGEERRIDKFLEREVPLFRRISRRKGGSLYLLSTGEIEKDITEKTLGTRASAEDRAAILADHLATKVSAVYTMIDFLRDESEFTLTRSLLAKKEAELDISSGSGQALPDDVRQAVERQAKSESVSIAESASGVLSRLERINDRLNQFKVASQAARSFYIDSSGEESDITSLRSQQVVKLLAFAYGGQAASMYVSMLRETGPSSEKESIFETQTVRILKQAFNSLLSAMFLGMSREMGKGTTGYDIETGRLGPKDALDLEQMISLRQDVKDFKQMQDAAKRETGRVIDRPTYQDIIRGEERAKQIQDKELRAHLQGNEERLKGTTVLRGVTVSKAAAQAQKDREEALGKSVVTAGSQATRRTGAAAEIERTLAGALEKAADSAVAGHNVVDASLRVKSLVKAGKFGQATIAAFVQPLAGALSVYYTDLSDITTTNAAEFVKAANRSLVKRSPAHLMNNPPLLGGVGGARGSRIYDVVVGHATLDNVDRLTDVIKTLDGRQVSIRLEDVKEALANLRKRQASIFSIAVNKYAGLLITEVIEKAKKAPDEPSRKEIKAVLDALGGNAPHLINASLGEDQFKNIVGSLLEPVREADVSTVAGQAGAKSRAIASPVIAAAREEAPESLGDVLAQEERETASERLMQQLEREREEIRSRAASAPDQPASERPAVPTGPRGARFRGLSEARSLEALRRALLRRASQTTVD